MRAVCETCEAAQPVGWKAGDLCVACGHVVRRERRCHWCAGWTPDGRFCRTCGAEILRDEQFAAGRMLKNAGVDQFSIRERLASFDSKQIENLTRLYQRQAVVVARLVDELVFIEQFLHQRVWASELDDQLTPRLPMPDDELAALRLPPGRDPAETMRLESIAATAPIPSMRSLAAIARLRISPSPIGTEAGSAIVSLATDATTDSDPRIRDEAALAMAGWRVLYGPSPIVNRRSLADALEAVVVGGRFVVDAYVGLRLLGHDVVLDVSRRPTIDADAAFAWAMALAETDALSAALRSPELRFAAALRLAEIGNGTALASVLDDLSETELVRVLEELPRDSAQPGLHDALLRLAETSPNERLRDVAVKLLVAEGRPADAAHLIALAPSEQWIVQSVIQRLPLDTADLTSLCITLVAEGRFVMHQYGVSDLATSGRLREDFVPRVWTSANTDELRCELLRFAEEQLKARGDEDLHAYVLRVMFGPWSSTVRAEAWWGLKRWYTSIEYASDGPLLMDAAAIERFFGNVPVFFERFIALLDDRATLVELTLQEKLGSMLRYAPAETLPALVGIEPSWTRFRAALLRTMHDVEIRLDLRSSIVRFFELVAAIDADHRFVVLADLAAVTEQAVPDLAYEASSTAARIIERYAEPARDIRSYGD